VEGVGRDGRGRDGGGAGEATEVGMAGAGDLTRVAGSVGGAVAAAPGVICASAAASTAPEAEEVEAVEFLLGGRVDGRAGASAAREEEEVVEEVGESGRAMVGEAVVGEVEAEEEGRGRVAEEKGFVSSLGDVSPLLSSSSFN